MVLLIARLCKLHNKLDNHHHDDSEASLQAFRSEVSNSLNSIHLKPDLDTLSLSWVHDLLERIPIINKAFGKLVVKIEYPLSRWEVGCVEEYLSYSLKLLELLNSISFCVSHLAHSRLSLSHALSLVETSPDSALDHLKKSTHHLFTVNKDCVTFGEDGENKITPSFSSSGKEVVINEALVVMKRVGFWVCGIVLSALSGDAKPYMEMREKAVDLDSMVCEVVRNRRQFRLKEVGELIEAVDGLIAGGGRSGTEELRRQLERFEKTVDGLGKEVNGLFSEVFAGRNQLLDSLRSMKP